MSKKVLCVCFGNACRSPMFETLLGQELSRRGSDISVESAGVAEKESTPASDNAIACMRERGLDLTSHRSRRVRDFDLSSFYHVFCMEESFVPELVALGVPLERITVVNKERGGIPNPWGGDLEVYRRCAETLAREAEVTAEQLLG